MATEETSILNNKVFSMIEPFSSSPTGFSKNPSVYKISPVKTIDKYRASNGIRIIIPSEITESQQNYNNQKCTKIHQP